MLCAISCAVIRRFDVLGDFLYIDYIQFFERCGINLLPISNGAKDIETYFDNFPLEGLILTGGNDLSHEFTGSKDGAYNENSFVIRDEQETRLLDAAIKRCLPVLGICRGMQFINCYYGGKIIQDIKNLFPNAKNHVNSIHTLGFLDNQWIEILGTDETEVNSFHHQGLTENELSPELKIIAKAKQDGIVEALYHPKYPIAGIQWHPERDNPNEEINEKIIDSFKNGTTYWTAKNRRNNK